MVTRSCQQGVTAVEVTPVLGLGMVARVSRGIFQGVTISQYAHHQAGAHRSTRIGGRYMRPRLGQGMVRPDMRRAERRPVMDGQHTSEVV